MNFILAFALKQYLDAVHSTIDKNGKDMSLFETDEVVNVYEGDVKKVRNVCQSAAIYRRHKSQASSDQETVFELHEDNHRSEGFPKLTVEDWKTLFQVIKG